MKLSECFNPKVFVAMIILCAALAGIAAWVMELSFLILAGILVAAVLVNGLVATIEDNDFEQKRE